MKMESFQIMPIESSRPNLNDLQLCREAFNPSTQTWQFLQENSYLASQLLQWYLLEPFPSSFVPKEIEIIFDGVTFFRKNHREIYVLKYPDSQELKEYQAEYSEYLFNGEIALFHCRGEVLIDRTQNLAEISLQHLLPNVS